ncbi:hypothetical protein [Parasitella parasitica]|uniref:Uncharacterized protein n=1 Tax=Parasitella parasitica TaxID=35722 RepID=A0A0B7MYD1_9FUNG|nr:hypothetical protein [Parasitella parasitica]
MSTTVEEVRNKGKSVWVSHFAEIQAVVAEIEQIWCFKYQQHSRKNNPELIYYIAHTNAIRKHELALMSEADQLVKSFPQSDIDIIAKYENGARREKDRPLKRSKLTLLPATAMSSDQNNLKQSLESLISVLQSQVNELKKQVENLK